MGIPQKTLKPEWSNVLKIFQLFFTCEGRYSKIHLYHMRFLCHLAGFRKMSLPYFLHQSLLRKSTKAKTILELLRHDTCHHGVIKILYIHELDKKIQTLRQRTWRNPAPKRPRNGKAKTLVETLALKIEVELSHVPVEKNLVEEQNIKVYQIHMQYASPH